MTEDEMENAVRGLATKADKIRRLSDLGVPRAAIANYLQIRYQHVRNVLVGPKPKEKPVRDCEEPKSPTQSFGQRTAMGLTIDEAKEGLALNFGIHPSAVEIIIRG